MLTGLTERGVGWMIRAYKFLMRPTARQAVALGEMLRDHCSLYNGALQERRDAYRHTSKTTVRYGMQSGQLKDIRAFDPERQGRWPFSSQQATLRRPAQGVRRVLPPGQSRPGPGVSTFSWGELVRHGGVPEGR
jgi:putative transposase